MLELPGSLQCGDNYSEHADMLRHSHLRSETDASSLVSVPMIQAEKQSLSSRRMDSIYVYEVR